MGTYCGTILLGEERWSLDAGFSGWHLAGEISANAENGRGNFRGSGRRLDLAGLLEMPPAGRLRSGGVALTGLLGSVAWTMWMRSRPAVVVRRSNSWTRLFWMRARSLRRVSHSLSNDALSSAICQPMLLLHPVHNATCPLLWHNRPVASLLISGSFSSDFRSFSGFENFEVPSGCLGETSVFQIIMIDDVTLWSKLESNLHGKSTRF